MKSYVFSVNQHDIAVDCGQLGIYTINGNGGKIFGKTLVNDRHVPKDLGDDRFEDYVEKGESIVKDIVSRNEEDGFFVAVGNEPSMDEIRDAIAAYKNVCVYAVRNADVIWEKTRNREVIPERARRAARYLGVTPEWLDQTVSDTKECPKCAEAIKAKALVCRFCGFNLETGDKQPVPQQAAQQKR